MKKDVKKKGQPSPERESAMRKIYGGSIVRGVQ